MIHSVSASFCAQTDNNFVDEDMYFSVSGKHECVSNPSGKCKSGGFLFETWDGTIDLGDEIVEHGSTAYYLITAVASKKGCGGALDRGWKECEATLYWKKCCPDGRKYDRDNDRCVPEKLCEDYKNEKNRLKSNPTP